MKAVNLIPVDARKGGGNGRAGRSGGAVYALLGALALLVAIVAATTLAGRGVDQQRADLDRVTQEATAAEARASALAPYQKFADLRAKRVETVTSLADSRFDWAHAFHEVARVLPDNAWLTTVVGTAAPGVALEGGSTGASGMRGVETVPAVEMTGCTTSNSSVAKVMSQLRLIDGVTGVSLADAEKGAITAGAGATSDSAGSSGQGGGGSTDCRNGHAHFPRFDVVVFFRAGTGTADPAVAGLATPGATGTATTASTTTPSTTTPPATTTPTTGASK